MNYSAVHPQRMNCQFSLFLWRRPCFLLAVFCQYYFLVDIEQFLATNGETTVVLFAFIMSRRRPRPSKETISSDNRKCFHEVSANFAKLLLTSNPKSTLYQHLIAVIMYPEEYCTFQLECSIASRWQCCPYSFAGITHMRNDERDSEFKCDRQIVSTLILYGAGCVGGTLA